MKKIIFLIFLFSFAVIASCRNLILPIDSDSCHSVYNSELKRSFYINVDKFAEYPDGDITLIRYVSNNTTLEGFKMEDLKYGELVIIVLYIDEHGILIDLEPINKKGLENGFLQKQVITTLRDIPFWIPAECNGKKIPFKKTFAIRFNLRNIGKWVDHR